MHTAGTPPRKESMHMLAWYMARWEASDPPLGGAPNRVRGSDTYLVHIMYFV